MSVFQEKETPQGAIQYGPFTIVPAACVVEGDGTTAHLDPKAMELLCLMAMEPGRSFAAEELCTRIWPGEAVTGATLARTLTKLRKALGDDEHAPHFIETLPENAYRLIADPQTQATERETAAVRQWFAIPDRWRPQPKMVAMAAAVIAVLGLPVAGILGRVATPTIANQTAELVEQADDAYFKYQFASNETAVELYMRAIRRDPQSSRAHSGLANALVQRAMRWPMGGSAGAKSFARLSDALKAGYVDQAQGQSTLRRAYRMATRAVLLNPRDAAAHKSLALVQSALRNFDDALNSYKLAIALDPGAWGPMINIGDILEIQGRPAEAVPYFEMAYAAMERVYGPQTIQVRPWHSELGIHIGDAYRARGELKQSAQWYRKVLDTSPLHPAAAGRLANVLQQAGDAKGAREVCRALKSRLGNEADCKS